MTKPKIAYIGTGAMGKPMILKLLKSEYAVNVYDKYKEAADPVVAAGAVWLDSPKEVARGADIVMTNLPLPNHVTENMLGKNGALAAMKTGSTWIDFSTTDYHNTQRIAKIAKTAGVYSLESPVSNLSHMGVNFGNISFYISGDREGYERCKDVLDDIGKISFFAINEIGKAQAIKLLTNLLCYASIIILGEVLMIAKTNGIPLDWMWDFIKASPGNSFAAEQISPFIFDGSYDYSCHLEIGVKDTALTVQLAEELGCPLLLGKVIADRYQQAGEKYKSSDNYIIVTKLVEDENNLDLRIPGFIAPSPYGANRNYVYSCEFSKDDLGRVKPNPYTFNYVRPTKKLEDDLENIAQVLTEFMAYLNYLFLEECYALGKNIGISHSLLADCINWGCGDSWVANCDNLYKPQKSIIDKFKSYNFEKQVKVPTLDRIISLL